MEETGQISTSKVSDLHTIKCLKRELRKKGEVIQNLAHRLDDNEEIKRKYEEFNEFF